MKQYTGCLDMKSEWKHMEFIESPAMPALLGNPGFKGVMYYMDLSTKLELSPVMKCIMAHNVQLLPLSSEPGIIMKITKL